MMLCCEVKTDERRHSDQIDEHLIKYAKKFRSSIRLLLLGTGESGKSTVLKQMTLIHNNGFSQDEKMTKLVEIRNNIHESILELIKQMTELGIHFRNVDNILRARKIEEIGIHLNVDYTENISYASDVRNLWSDKGIQECYKRSNEYQLIDSAKYFLDQVETVMSPNFIPSNDDILNHRKETTGVSEVEFIVKVSRKQTQDFIMVDVGGQRAFRDKWAQVFHGVNAILFIISCAEFDLRLREDKKVNRMKESLQVFQNVWRSKFLRGSGMIVFLNKQDILEQKIKNGAKIENYFNEYKSFVTNKSNVQELNEYHKARSFVQFKIENITKVPIIYNSYTNSAPQIVNNRACYFHNTIATNTENITVVFWACRDIIIEQNLSKTDLE